ncbi:hypothetical protein BDAP_002426 [Binucleata daphniae]
MEPLHKYYNKKQTTQLNNVEKITKRDEKQETIKTLDAEYINASSNVYSDIIEKLTKHINNLKFYPLLECEDDKSKSYIDLLICKIFEKNNEKHKKFGNKKYDLKDNEHEKMFIKYTNKQKYNNDIQTNHKNDKICDTKDKFVTNIKNMIVQAIKKHVNEDNDDYTVLENNIRKHITEYIKPGFFKHNYDEKVNTIIYIAMDYVKWLQKNVKMKDRDVITTMENKNTLHKNNVEKIMTYYSKLKEHVNKNDEKAYEAVKSIQKDLLEYFANLTIENNGTERYNADLDEAYKDKTVLFVPRFLHHAYDIISKKIENNKIYDKYVEEYYVTIKSIKKYIAFIIYYPFDRNYSPWNKQTINEIDDITIENSYNCEFSHLKKLQYEIKK